MLHRLASKIKRVWHRQLRRLRPVKPLELQATLDQLVDVRPDALFVHSSLSACGYLSGGPAAVVGTLQAITPNLVLPTHTYCYPAAGQTVGPVFDASQTPSLVGAISDWFWRQSGVLRSIHPTHSVAAAGPKAASICADHQLADTPCGSQTPYDKLLQMRSAVLMFGCTLNTYTLFHTSEHFAECPYLYYPQKVSLQFRDADGQVKQLLMRRQNMEFARRFADMDIELAQAGLLRSQTLRYGKLLYLPDAQSVHAYLMERMSKKPNYLLKSL